MANQLPITVAVAALPADFDGTPMELAEAIAERLTLSSQETFAIFVKSTTEPASNVGLWFDPVNKVWKEWDDEEGRYVEQEYTPDQIKAGKLGVNGAVNISARGKLFHPDYPTVLFNRSEVGVQVTDPYTTSTGTAFSFDKCIPVRMVGPGHADASGGVYPIISPNADGYAYVLVNARILNDSPDVDALCVFIELNDSGVYSVLQAISSDDAGNQIGTGFRRLLIAVTDSIKFFVAPSDGTGAIASSVTCRVELDVMAING
jgi:hypothetical protein